MFDPAAAGLGTGVYQGNLLNPAIRREIAELNRLFLDHALHPDHCADAWFRLPAATVVRFSRAAEEVRERAARSPITLFEVRLPGEDDAPDDPAATGCADAPSPVRAEARRAFGVTALGVFRRLSEGVPLAPRIAFGLDAGLEARLAALSLSESYRLAAWSGLIRPRWLDHVPFWQVLADAVTRADAVHWAYASGLCLLAQCERAPQVGGASRRCPRSPPHRRATGVRRDVPC
jgi:hypothetical protein